MNREERDTKSLQSIAVSLHVLARTAVWNASHWRSGDDQQKMEEADVERLNGMLDLAFPPPK